MIRIFCGTETKTKVAELVLEHSIRKRTQAEVEFIPMGDYEPWLISKYVHQATGFSLRRFLIPQYCNFEGRAIYMDADQLVLGDIQELWDFGKGMYQAACLAFHNDKTAESIGEEVPQTSVMVINCGDADRTLWNKEWISEHIQSKGVPHSGKKVVFAYQWIMHGYWFPVKHMTKRWNDFNHWQSDTKLLHYTFETDQPWYNPHHHLSYLWENELKSACEAGAVCKEHLEHGLELGRKGSNDWRVHGGLHEYWKHALDWCVA